MTNEEFAKDMESELTDILCGATNLPRSRVEELVAKADDNFYLRHVKATVFGEMAPSAEAVIVSLVVRLGAPCRETPESPACLSCSLGSPDFCLQLRQVQRVYLRELSSLPDDLKPTLLPSAPVVWLRWSWLPPPADAPVPSFAETRFACSAVDTWGLTE